MIYDNTKYNNININITITITITKMAEKLAFNIGGTIFLVDDINLDNFDLNNIQVEPCSQETNPSQPPQPPQPQQPPPSSNSYGLTDKDYEMIVQEVDSFVHNPLIKNDDLYFTFIFSLFKKGICRPRCNQMNINIINRVIILYNYAIIKWKYIYQMQPTQLNLELAKREINAVFAFLDAELNK
jgi:hypothetical protein